MTLKKSENKHTGLLARTAEDEKKEREKFKRDNKYKYFVRFRN